MRRDLRRLFTALILALGVSSCAAVAAWADPPARVGRLSDIAGTVSFHLPGETQWSPAPRNYPVTTGSSYWTEPESRAEIRLGSVAIHLDAATELDVVALDDRQLTLGLTQGRINFRIPRIVPGESYAVETSRGTLRITEAGTFRITAGSQDQPAEIAVLEGRAKFIGTNASLSMSGGEAALVSGENETSFSLEEAQATPFDDDALARERREDERPALRYVSPEMTGYEDLDDHGSWADEHEYGPVWYPSEVPPDWAPYRVGHWAWIDPWGWTWIDDQPWGFAPFHYGRWVMIGERWGWCPGRIVPRPVYAPALVAFIGGARWSVSVGTEPSVGWFPLAPREIYVPAYRTSVDYVRQVNITNVTNVTNITNQTIQNFSVAPGAYANQPYATVVKQSHFFAARPVQQGAIALPRQALMAAPVATGVPIAPQAAAELHHPAAVRAAIAAVSQTQAQPVKPIPAMKARPEMTPGPATAHEPPRPAETSASPAERPEEMKVRPSPTAAPFSSPVAGATSGPAPGPAIRPTPSSAFHVDRPGQREAGMPANKLPGRIAPNPPPHPPAVIRTAPPAEHVAPHPVQQTVLQPTRQGWVRAAGPAPRQAQAVPPPTQPPHPQAPSHPQGPHAEPRARPPQDEAAHAPEGHRLP